VLPFTNMSGDPEQEYFVDGITEDLITKLSRFPDYLVIARSTTFQYKRQAVDVREVARELNAAPNRTEVVAASARPHTRALNGPGPGL
jgi:TolB-like protein